ncbi:MAG: O-antigen ligase family protein [Desulfotignum sp.]|nr:O-antigen ligase family protein [Desulfotignum sp.]
MMFPTGTAPPLVVVILAFLAWLVSGAWQNIGNIVRQSWFWPVIPFFVLPWVGLAYSQNLDIGMDYAMKTKYWALLFITAGICMDGTRTLLLVGALWLGLFSGAILAVAQLLGVIPLLKPGFPGFGIVHTFLSMYLIIGILMAGFYFRTIRDVKVKAIILVLIFLFVIHLALLKGRAGYLIFALMAPVVAGDLMHRFSLKMKSAAAIALVLCLALSPVVRDTVIQTIDTLQTNKEKALKGEDIAEMPRFYFVKQSLDAMRQNPIMGIGTGSITEFTRPHGHVVNHPHNTFLYMGVSFGLPGILAYFWLFWVMCKISWGSRHTPLGYFVLSTCVVLFLGGMFDTHLLNTGTLLMFSLTYGFLGQLAKPV